MIAASLPNVERLRKLQPNVAAADHEQSRGQPASANASICVIRAAAMFLAAQGTEPVNAPSPRRLVRPAFDTQAYKARNLIKRAFCRLKGWRAIATRYSKTTRNSVGGICLAVTASSWMQRVRALIDV